MRSVELFAGAGGLALGTHLAGFTTEVVCDLDRWCCDTLRENQASGHPLVQGMDVWDGDVRDIDWSSYAGQIDVVSGSPPCQPPSGAGMGDPRDMFPVTAEVIRLVHPKAFIVENVPGLTHDSVADYFAYIQLMLAHPDVTPQDESWSDHIARLQAEHTSVRDDVHYHVVTTLVNAADYGVPQQLWRVFIVGFRSDVDAEWSFPEPTHSAESLRISQQQTGEYWERHLVPEKNRPKLTMQPRLLELPLMRPWRTVRDAIGDLPEPTEYANRLFLNHVLQPGARSYHGHTGSFLDEPAKALKAGVRGVPEGENTLRLPDGSVRYFTVREAARLQTFPDRYALHGAWSEAMRRLCNAVPVLLTQIVASSVHEHLTLADLRATMATRSRRPATARALG